VFEIQMSNLNRKTEIHVIACGHIVVTAQNHILAPIIEYSQILTTNYAI